MAANLLDVNLDDSDEKCMICLENLSNEQQYSLPECSHTFHQNCIMQWFRSGSHKCPLCNKTMYDATPLWNIIEQYVENTEMPEEYHDKTSDIICNDCQEKSNVPFHFMYHKCPNCNSWNTDLVKIEKY